MNEETLTKVNSFSPEYYKLYKGNCLELLKNIPDKSIDMILTDPPYDISATNGGGTINKIKKMNISLKQLEDAQINRGYDIEKFGDEFMRVMKEPNIYLWCNKKQIPEYFNYYINKHKCKFEILVYIKSNALPTYSNKYLSDKEYCLYFYKGKGKTFPKSYDDAKTYQVGLINHKDKKIWNHPTIKWLDFTEKIVRNSSRENWTILDPFMGSGTTGVAALNNNRRFIGMELNEEYFNMAKKRIEETYVNIV